MFEVTGGPPPATKGNNDTVAVTRRRWPELREILEGGFAE
jgi:hypothetical protein